MKLYKFTAALAAVALAVGMTACNDDNTTYDYPGVDGQVVLSPTVNAEYMIVKTPNAMVAPTITWETDVRSRIPAEEELTMKFAVDNSLIESYNAANETDFVALPDGMITLVVPELPVEDEPEVETQSRAASEALLSIPAGKTASQVKITAELTSDQALLSSLDLDTKYLVPIRMTEVVKGDARLAVSATNISYLAFTLSELQINESGSPTGTIVPKADRGDWDAVPGDGADEWWGWYYPLVMERNYSYGAYPTGSTVTFDFGATKTFDGVYAAAYYNMSSYALFRAGSEILVSNDGSSWTSLGTLQSTHVGTIAFYAPQTARYLKVILGNGSYVACTAFSIYAL